VARHSLKSVRTWLPVVAVGCAIAPGIATEPTPVCVGETVTAPDLREFLVEAIDVLSACGHAPEAFGAELHLDDPFVLAGTGRKAEVTVVFEPLDPRRHYALGVSASDPCVVTWIWRPEEFTDWQKLVLERARSQARDAGAAWVRRTDGLELRITESRRHIGVRLWAGEGAGSPELRVVLAKDDLTVMESGSTGD